MKMDFIKRKVNYKNFRTSFVMLSLLMCFQIQAFSQVKSIGLPLINNFTRASYKASAQNWDVTQNNHGFLYFANNDGLLEFDGQHWTIYPIPNRSIVRAVKAKNDTIYVGAFEEFGFFAPDENGLLRYHPLQTLIPQQNRFFDEIWKIHFVGKAVIFQSFKYLFIYNEGKLEVVEPMESFGHSFSIGPEFIYVEHPQKLMRYGWGQTSELLSDPLLNRSELRCVLPMGKGKYLLGFINEGLFMLENGRLNAWNTEVNKALLKNSIFSATKLSGGNLAFGSIQDGLFISDEQGRVIQHLNRFKGLQNNTILSMFEDSGGNLWLGLDNGIDFIEINSPLSVFDHTYHIESSYAAVVFREKLYVGTNQGLFYKSLHDLSSPAGQESGFSFVEGTEGQVWSLQLYRNTLLCGHNFGLFQIEDEKAIKVNAERGYWTFYPTSPTADTLLCGTYNGLTLVSISNGKWSFVRHVQGFNESCKSFVFLPESNEVWMAHGYRGLYHLVLSPTKDRVLQHELFRGVHGLPDELPYNVFHLQGHTTFSTKNGLMVKDAQSGEFVMDAALNGLFGDYASLDQASTDGSGNVWYFSNGRMGLLRRLEDGSFSNVTAPFMRINNQLIQAYENVFVYDNRNVFIGTKNGLVHYDPYYRKDYYRGLPLVFREITFESSADRWVNYNFISNQLNQDEIRNDEVSVDFSMNNFRVTFANPEFEGTGSCLFSFRLKGVEKDWSEWNASTFKEYTNLPEGSYVFELKGKSANHPDEKYLSFSFNVRPPFYRTWLAYLLYVIVLIGVVVGNVFFIQRRVSLTRQREKEKHHKALREQEMSFREQALMAEKEIINLKNESLQSQVIHKNKELANNTLHLIHKNKILNAIKSNLNSLLDNSLNQTKRAQVEAIISKINRELKNEKFQEVFDEYFDDVHQDFISRLKEKHPDLSPRELRLCAYLKMNLSTKEIAPLMNISVRGVEIGRYRLRKKLELERDENLIDYLLKL